MNEQSLISLSFYRETEKRVDDDDDDQYTSEKQKKKNEERYFLHYTAMHMYLYIQFISFDIDP